MATNTESNTYSSDFSDLVDNNDSLMVSLKRFMNQYELAKDDRKTNTNIICNDYQYKKRFYVPSAGIPQLMQHLLQCYNAGITLHFLEASPNTTSYETGSGLAFDFTFITNEANVAFEDAIAGFLKILFEEVLIKVLRMPKTGHDIHHCILLGSPKSEYIESLYKYKQVYKIIIPSIQVGSLLKKFIFDRLWNSPALRELFKKKTNVSFRNAFQYNTRSIPNCLIGSCTIKENAYLELMSIQKAAIEDGATYEGISIVSNPAGLFKNLVYECSLNYEMPAADGGIIRKRVYLPRSSVIKMIEDKMTNPDEQMAIAYDQALVDIAQLSIYDDVFDQFKKILDMISDERIANESQRADIISALASRGNKYHCIALWFCRSRCKTMTLDEFNQLWFNAVNKKDVRNDLKSLRYWAGLDSPSEMRRFLEKQVRQMLLRDVKGMISGGSVGHTNIAAYLEFMFKNVFATAVVGKTTCWYEFVTPSTKNQDPGQLYKWKFVGSHPVSLSEYISSDLAEITQKVLLELSQEINSAKDDDRKKYLKSLKATFLRSIKQIFNTPFKRNVIEATADKFADSSLIKRMDKTKHIMGVGNGVLEFNGPEVRLLNHYHSYPITMYTETDYIPYDPENEYIKTVYKMLHSLFPANEMDAFDFIMYYLSTSLDWHPKESLFLIITGQGCHAIDTPIRMFDGSLKMVQDIAVGDQIMGDDSTVRNVQELFRGTDEMVEIIPIKGDPFVVNKNHILSLKFTSVHCTSKRSDGYYAKEPKYRACWYEHNGINTPSTHSKMFDTRDEAQLHLNTLLKTNKKMIKKGDVIDIKVQDLRKWPTWWVAKSNVTLYKSSAIQYSEKDLKLDPYFLGYWLGDGTSRTPEFTTMDLEVVADIESKLPEGCVLKKSHSKGKASYYRINDPTGQKNRVLECMHEYNLMQNKHIPIDFKTSSCAQRLEILAGLMDSDGHYQKSMNQYELTLKDETLFDDVLDLVRSLGFAAYKKSITKICTNGKDGPITGNYFRMQIYGEGIETIPCRIARKQAVSRTKEKNALLNGFTMKSIGDGDYYGFELDGNHRYMSGDYTVHHNSNGKSILIEFFRETIGEMYARRMPLSFITEQTRTKSAAADPAMMEMKYARFVNYSESERNERANIARIKELTGGDTMAGRQLYGEQENFKPNCNHLLATNHHLRIESTEHAVWRRFLTYKFKMTFKENPDPENEFERTKDSKFINMLKDDKRFHAGFLSILTYYRTRLYSEYDGQILKVPHPTIKEETDIYRQQEDIYERFIVQRVFYKENKPVQTMDEFLTIFRNYYRNENGERLKIKNEELKYLFLNSSIQKFIKFNPSGVCVLHDVYTIDEAAPIIPGSMLYKEYLKTEPVS